jgi:hypothetical protein
MHLREFRQFVNHRDDFSAQKPQGLPHEDDVRVVSHVTACRAQMNNGGGCGALQTVRVKMRHNVMAHFFSCSTASARF